MARTEGQSDFVFRPHPVEPLDSAVGGEAGELPRAVMRTSEASEVSTKWMLRITFVMLLAFALLCAIGPHIPAGE